MLNRLNPPVFATSQKDVEQAAIELGRLCANLFVLANNDAERCDIEISRTWILASLHALLNEFINEKRRQDAEPRTNT